MRRIKSNPNAPFQRISEVSRLTGIPSYYIRSGIKDGSIPHINLGKTCLVNLPAYLRQLGITLPDDDSQTENK